MISAALPPRARGPRPRAAPSIAALSVVALLVAACARGVDPAPPPERADLAVSRPPADDVSHPTGPSTVIRGIMQREAVRRARERQQRALDLEKVLHTDGGAR